MPPQLSVEVIYRNFCDPTLTSFLQSKEHMHLKVKRVVAPITKQPHWAMQGKTEESLPKAVFCNALHPWTAPDKPAIPGWLEVPLYNVWKLYQNSLLGGNKDKLTVATSSKCMCSDFPSRGLHMLDHPLKGSIYGDSNKRLSQASCLYTNVFSCFTTFFSMFPTLTLSCSLCCPWCFHRLR